MSNTNFITVLKKYGFKKCNTTEWPDPSIVAYENTAYNWFAEIVDYVGWKEVWLVGHGLKDCGRFPFGFNYANTDDLEQAIIEGIQKEASAA